MFTINRKRTLFIPAIASIILALMIVACASPAASPTVAPTTSALAQATQAPQGSTEPIYIGVSGPLTGDRAQYGAQWKKGFDLALEEINRAGGIGGRKLEYIFEDSQSDPKQSVVIAQKFVADPRIVVELGDFSSTASMAASKIYERGGLVQFGFTNSHPDFTYAGGDYTWSTSVTQNQASPALADLAVKTLGLKKLAIFQINNDWGKSTNESFTKRVKELGAEVVASQPYLDSEKDFRSAITTVRDANPDGIILVSYQADGALIAQQLREAGLNQPLVGSASIQSPDFTKLGGKAVEGTYILGEFNIQDPRPEVQTFVKKWQEKYGEDPDLFGTLAYDTIYLIKNAIEVGGATREGIHGALPRLKDVPSIVYKKITFDPTTRRSQDPQFNILVVKDGQFAAWDGTKPTAQ